MGEERAVGGVEPTGIIRSGKQRRGSWEGLETAWSREEVRRNVNYNRILKIIEMHVDGCSPLVSHLC